MSRTSNDRPGWLTGKHVAGVHNRLAAIMGAVALGLVAIVFARMGEVAQKLFLHLAAISPAAPFVVTPLIFAGVVYMTRRWFPAARGSGIPQVMAAGQNPVRHADGDLVSLKTAWAKHETSATPSPLRTPPAPSSTP